MDFAGSVIVLIGIYLITSSIKNRRPVETARKILSSPKNTAAIMRDSVGVGYQATATGAPTLQLIQGGQSAGGTDSGGYSSDPSMSLVSNAPPSKFKGVEAGLRPSARAGLRNVAAAFPQIKSVGGRAARPIATSDHPRGLAVDFMIPGYKTASGRALGDKVAAYSQKLPKVKYIIWYEKKWNPDVSNSWRPYKHPLGGGDTLAHRDHVHVSFEE